MNDYILVSLKDLFVYGTLFAVIIGLVLAIFGKGSFTGR